MLPARITRRSQLHGLGASSIAKVVSDASSIGREVAAGSIKGVTIRSQISPDLDLTGAQAMGQQPADTGVGQLFMAIAKPAIYVDTSLGTIRVAPWGEPKLNLFPVLLAGSILGGAVLLGLIIRGVRS